METTVFWTDGFGNYQQSVPIARFFDESREHVLIKHIDDSFRVIRIHARETHPGKEFLFGEAML